MSLKRRNTNELRSSVWETWVTLAPRRSLDRQTNQRISHNSSTRLRRRRPFSVLEL
jgi:hypothetical protein